MTPPILSSVLLHTATANGFQMVTSGAQSQAVSDWLITSVEVSPPRRSPPPALRLCTVCPHPRVLSPLCLTQEVVGTKELDLKLGLWLSGPHLPSSETWAAAAGPQSGAITHTWKAEAEGSGVQGYPGLPVSSRLALRYRRPCFNKKNPPLFQFWA